jgi:hypothetical protein
MRKRLSLSYSRLELKQRGLHMRADDVAGNICVATPRPGPPRRRGAVVQVEIQSNV